MKAHYLDDFPEVHSTPLQKICIDEDSSHIEFDDVDEIRWIVRFKTIQAWKCTDVNFFDMVKVLSDVTSSDGTVNRFPIVFEDSIWIEELKVIQNKKNTTESLFDNSKHILFILGDDIVEVIAGKNFIIEKMDTGCHGDARTENTGKEHSVQHGRFY